YEDLDDNGSWSNEPEYGYVWTPSRVAVDWSPYRYGRWVWVSPWGWTWIDDAPWGYAPFHYGRWAHVRERWCWVPGPRHVRAVYAPALVGWVGSPGVSVSVSIGSGVGWFPLGPREVYVPARRFSPRYVERVNVRNTVIVNRTTIVNVYNGRGGPVTYRNRGALTSVSRTTFTSSQRVGDHRIRMSETEIDRTRVTAAPPRIDPSRESRFGGSTRVVGRAPPRTVVDRQVVVNRPPPTSSARYTRPRTDARGNFDTRTRSENERGSNERGSNEPIVRDRPDRPAMQRERPIDRQVGGTNPPAGAQPNGKHVDDDPRADGRPQQRERPIDRQSGATELRTQETPRNERPDRPPREQLDRHQQDRQQRERDNGPDQPREVNTRPNWQRSNDQPREQRPQMEQRPVEPRQIEQRQVEQRQRAPEQRERPIERNVERPRSENRQENRPEPRQENRQENRQESRPPRNESRPAESRPPKQRDDQPKPNRN
ncbi:MAG TPA: DUF6600 domain-containing protein, partial [Steroidobacteraceae bacterium]|nr:DUF6600 domain-containing protein [Steroidobacteraceae bacterium]